jgi:spore photoproduct lyase
MSQSWVPSEIIVNDKVRNDSVTKRILKKCKNAPVIYVADGKPSSVINASRILSKSGKGIIDKVLAGKRVLYIGPVSGGTVDTFEMPDSRILCPHFERLKLASNGCFYQCDWCYLKLTFRANYPYIAVRAEYKTIIEQLRKRLDSTSEPVIFNSGELADSLSLEHLTGAARKFIPWFGKQKNGYLFMLTKSDNVDDILDLKHNKHTIIAWSMNNAKVSRKFEIGAPPFKRRLKAARKVEKAGYRLRIRLDPIVPIKGWRDLYSETIERIFNKVSPERITLGTLRFEEGLYRLRNSLFTTGNTLPEMLENKMEPMFKPKHIPGKKRPSIGKYSFTEKKRVKIFNFAINEIRKYSDCTIALCKESKRVWERVGLDPDKCDCVCQL